MTDIRAFTFDESGGASPAGAIRPVMQVTFWRSANGVPLIRTGTAFMISVWPRVLVTCAHLLEVGVNETPEALVLAGLGVDGAPFEIEAVSAAYPESFRDRDMALIRIAEPLTCPDAFAPATPTPESAVTIIGYRGPGDPSKVSARSTYAAPWIRYPFAATSEGMSGGPVLDAVNVNKVVGIHAGDVSIGGRLVKAGTALDAAVLTECLNKSFEVLSSSVAQ